MLTILFKTFLTALISSLPISGWLNLIYVFHQSLLKIFSPEIITSLFYQFIYSIKKIMWNSFISIIQSCISIIIISNLSNQSPIFSNKFSSYPSMSIFNMKGFLSFWSSKISFKVVVLYLRLLIHLLYLLYCPHVKCQILLFLFHKKQVN